MNSSRAEALRLILPLLSRTATEDFFGMEDELRFVDAAFGWDALRLLVEVDRPLDERDDEERDDECPRFWAAAVIGSSSANAKTAIPKRRGAIKPPACTIRRHYTFRQQAR